VFLNFRIPELSLGYLLTSEFSWTKCSHLDEEGRKCLRNTSTYILQDVNTTEAYQLSKRRLFLASFTSTALPLTFIYMSIDNFSPVIQLQNLSRDVSSGRNHKTFRGRWTDCYNERASGGTSLLQKPWHVVRWPSYISQDTLLQFNERTLGTKIYNSDFSAAALCSRRCYPHLRILSIQHVTSFLPVITIRPAVDQFRSHHIQKSHLWSSLVLSVFRSVAFHYAQKPVMRLSVYTSLPTACVIPYFVQTCRYIPLFVISARSTYFIPSDLLWTGQPGDWIPAESDFSFPSIQMHTKYFRGTRRAESSAEDPRLLAPRLGMVWSCTSASPIRPHMLVKLWLLPSPLLICSTFGIVTNIYAG